MLIPKWLNQRIVLAIHGQLVAEYGGSAGLRDEGLLDSALAKPQNLLAYEEQSSICALEAAYGFGIARNHPFVDGNKRAAFMAMYVFLDMNGVSLEAVEAEATLFMYRLAAGEETQEDLAAWLERYCQPIGDS
jgi:death on curing protein